VRVLVCGDRNWLNKALVKKTLEELSNVEVVIEGEARGADTCGRICATELGIPVIKFPADWKRHGLAAGPIRNSLMLKEGRPDLVLAFHSNIKESKGTKHMISIAEKAGIKVILITE
jgi:hypothetical protein